MSNKRLVDFGDIHGSTEIKKIDEVEGLELTIKDFTEAQGEMGVYAFIYCVNPAGDEITVMTGASLILGALRDAKTQGMLPVDAIFKKRGRAWIAE